MGGGKRRGGVRAKLEADARFNKKLVEENVQK